MSRYTGWKAGFPDDVDSFQKRKVQPVVDYDAITRHVLSALKPILNEKGIDLSDDLVINVAPVIDPRSSNASVGCRVE